MRTTRTQRVGVRSRLLCETYESLEAKVLSKFRKRCNEIQKNVFARVEIRRASTKRSSFHYFSLTQSALSRGKRPSLTGKRIRDGALISARSSGQPRFSGGNRAKTPPRQENPSCCAAAGSARDSASPPAKPAAGGSSYGLNQKPGSQKIRNSGRL